MRREKGASKQTAAKWHMKTPKSACRVIEGRMTKSGKGLKGCQSALLSYCYLFPRNMEPKTPFTIPEVQPDKTFKKR